MDISSRHDAAYSLTTQGAGSGRFFLSGGLERLLVDEALLADEA
jgi:hypothetical protein